MSLLQSEKLTSQRMWCGGWCQRKNGGFLRAQFCTEVARSEGFEPPTPRFEVWCSIQLSYERRSPF
jgi:hypothetical protein